MKFSVLLPTRNRLNLLKHAVNTVLKQDYDNWEIIISDNFSEEDIKTYVMELGDYRIKYYKTNNFIPVTENWNNALKLSSGDYFIMLGDDDCLMKGYFSNMKNFIEKFNNPEVIYSSAYLFAYPNVIPNKPKGYLHEFSKGKIFKSHKNPFFLDKKTSNYLVKSSLNFKIKFDYNMQFSLIKKDLVKKLNKFGEFFQSPYPDYYASNVILLQSNSTLVVPSPMVTIGISPKSFGFYYFNNKEIEGNKFLKNIADPFIRKKLKNIILPGSNMNDSWLLSMQHIVNNFGKEKNLKVNYKRYRFLQIIDIFSQLFLNNIHKKDLFYLRKKLNIFEKSFIFLPLSTINFFLVFFPFKVRKFFSNLLLFLRRSHPKKKVILIEGKFANISEVFEEVNVMS